MKITFKNPWWVRLRERFTLSPGAKPWFFEPQRWWNLPRGVYLVGNRAMQNKPEDRAEKLSSYIRVQMPHAFLVNPHDSTFMGLSEWLEQNTTSVYTFGKFPSFTQFAVFLHDDDDAFAFRMRWFCKYVKTKGDPEFDEFEQMRQHMGLLTGTLQSMLRNKRIDF